MNKWLWFFVVFSLLCCGILFVAFGCSPNLNQDSSPSTTFATTIPVNDSTELRGLISAHGGTKGGILIAICDEKRDRKPGTSAGPFGSYVNEKETVWAIITQSGTPDEKSHVVPKNSLCYVDKYDRVTPFVITDEKLVRTLIDLSVSKDKEEQKMSLYLFEGLIRYAYETKFSPDKRETPNPSKEPDVERSATSGP